MMYTITRGPSKLVTQRRTGPTQQLDGKISDFKHKQTSWNMPGNQHNTSLVPLSDFPHQRSFSTVRMVRNTITLLQLCPHTIITKRVSPFRMKKMSSLSLRPGRRCYSRSRRWDRLHRKRCIIKRPLPAHTWTTLCP
ncbi:uncharacterized protein LOC100699489 isoform X2 [Oreochromis niloticus]|uniref:uncharacterized protein LOC100699489 isoform X2 n=1 Tax=Oreochromis niloticus TaxID=8128 RepID=UPI000904F5FB|nr:uncharacterized protein LOC100699489 isoform X2 [Oreochromis niloticus]